MGGLDEVGKNAYVIEHNQETLMIDYGIKFANHEQPGVSGIVPNLSYFLENKITIDALIITHGHEDHLGGIPYLIQHLQIKTIYLSVFASELIKKKLAEIKKVNFMPKISLFDDYSTIKTHYFEIDFFRVCHSLPDSFGVFVKTPNGNFVSAGDYRIDFGKETDDTNIHKLVEIAKRNVDVFLAESTNSDQPGFSQSEDYILNNIEALIKNATGRIFISTFASNLTRIEKIIKRALVYGRKICVLGRSMETNLRFSKKIGYLKIKETDFINIKELSLYQDNQIMIVLTGSQGEERGALNLLANNLNTKITLKPTDTIVLSSNPIPGNYKNVESLINKLYKCGVKLYQNTPNYKIHASGHATKQEQQMMIKIIKAKYIMPIHGETKMLHALKRNCLEIGYQPEQIIILKNGIKAQLKKHKVDISKQKINASAVYIDQISAAGENDDNTINKRIYLSKNGIFNVILVIDKQKNQITRLPMIATRGCFFAKTSSSLISKICFSIQDNINENLLKNQNLTKEEIKKNTERIVKFYIFKNKKKKPIILTTIFYE